MEKTTTPKPTTAPDMLAEAAKHVTLDRVMREDPANVTPEMRRELIKVLRAERVRFTEAEAAKKAKGSAAVDEEDEED